LDFVATRGAASRAAKGSHKQYRELARRFVRWRQRNMLAIVKAWKIAAVSAEKRLSKPGARKAKKDQARIARANRLLRKGAISRAGHALESKGIGDLEDPEIWEQMKRKHPSKKEAIDEVNYKFQTKEEVELKVGKILPKLDMNAALRPSGLRDTHLWLWMGVFAPPAANEAI
jgi:hypothetical protein